jgi:MFS family permease
VTIELGSVLGAIVLVCVPLAAWLSRRFTRESRLLDRIGRLGDAHAKLPDSDERARLGATLTRLAHELNEWTTVETQSVRRWRFWAATSAMVLTIAIGAVISPLLGHNQLAVFLIFGALGLLAGTAGAVVTELVERRATRRSKTADEARRGAAFRAGTTLSQ